MSKFKQYIGAGDPFAQTQTGGAGAGGLIIGGAGSAVYTNNVRTNWQDIPFFTDPEGDLCLVTGGKILKIKDVMNLIERMNHLEAEFALLGGKPKEE